MKLVRAKPMSFNQMIVGYYLEGNVIKSTVLAPTRIGEISITERALRNEVTLFQREEANRLIYKMPRFIQRIVFWTCSSVGRALG